MDEIVKIITEEIVLLDKEDEEGEEFRKSLNVDELSKEELLKFKIDLIISHMGFKNLYSSEKNKYFNKLICSCLGYTNLSYSDVSCITPDKEFKIFVRLDWNNNDRILFYCISNSEIKETTLEEIEELFNNGMKSLSKDGKRELIEGTKSNLGVEKGIFDIIRSQKISKESIEEARKRIQQDLLKNAKQP